MKHNLVITIGRESGSAGRQIGQMLASELGIKCYDKELLTLAAKQSGLCEELFKTHDEKQFSVFTYYGFLLCRIYRRTGIYGYAFESEGFSRSVRSD